MTYLYRFYDKHSSILVANYRVTKETPCGYWIKNHLYYGCAWTKKWVSKTSAKRFAYPTKQQAFESFIARKRMQIWHTTIKLSNLKALLSEATKMCNDQKYETVIISTPDYDQISP